VEHNPFDIIKVLNDDTLAWVEAAEELSAARLRVWQLLADSPGEYIVFNQQTKTLVAHFSIHETPQIPEWWRREDDYVETLQPVAAAIETSSASGDADFDDDYEDYVRFLQPAVA
jgi:hypothetical protein